MECVVIKKRSCKKDGATLVSARSAAVKGKSWDTTITFLGYKRFIHAKLRVQMTQRKLEGCTYANQKKTGVKTWVQKGIDIQLLEL